MHIDIGSLLIALTVSMLTIAIALPAVMGRVNAAPRRAQAGAGAQAIGWVLLMLSGLPEPYSWLDRGMSTLAMFGIAAGMALNATAFDLWCGREQHNHAPTVLALLIPLGYGIGFDDYAFRVGWANFLLAAQMALVTMALLRRPKATVGRWRWLLIIALGAQIIVTTWRGVLGAFYTAQFPTFLAPHPVNLAFALVANATAMLSLTGILLAHRDEAARTLERLATEDGLTGVLNRRAWLLKGKVELAVSVRYAVPLSLLMLDLDHFKHINDSRGHESGDRALQFFARAMQASARTGDVICRYGGEEFCILMNHADLAATHAFDVRLRAHLAEAAPAQLGHTLSYSAGIAMRGDDADTLEALLRRADAALYVAKAAGRARTMNADSAPARLQA